MSTLCTDACIPARILSEMRTGPSCIGRIFALVGPSACGKTALIEEMLRRFPADLVVMRSLTTRPRRVAEDDCNTRFVSQAEFQDLQASDALVQWVEYNGNFYGDARADVDEIIVSGKSAIRPLVETAVSSFREKGYCVALVRITLAASMRTVRRNASNSMQDARKRPQH